MTRSPAPTFRQRFERRRTPAPVPIDTSGVGAQYDISYDDAERLGLVKRLSRSGEIEDLAPREKCEDHASRRLPASLPHASAATETSAASASSSATSSSVFTMRAKRRRSA